MATSQIVSGHHKVSINPYRYRGTTYYQVAWRIGGQRKKCSYAKREDAEARAHEVLGMLERGLGSATEIPSRDLAFLEMVRQQLGDGNLLQAVQEFVAKRGGGETPPITSVLDEFLKMQKSIERSNRHIQTLRHHLVNFAAAFPKRIGDVGVEELDAYLHGLKLSQKSKLNHRISLIALFRFAQRKGWLPSDRKTAAELTERPKVVGGDPEVFTPEEIEKLLKAAGPETRAYLAIAAFAGIRSAEIHRLRWGNWNQEGNCITLSREITKTSRRRNVEVTENLCAWLKKECYGKQPTDKVVPIYNVHRFLRRVAEKAGVVWKQNALRHSYASYHLELFSDAARTSKNCGHSVRQLETTYLRLTSKSDAERWFSIIPETDNGKSTITRETESQLR